VVNKIVSKRPGYAYVTFTAHAFDYATGLVRVEFYLQIQKLLITLIKCSFVY
jgi:hypothetical protein